MAKATIMCPSCYGCGYVYNPNHGLCTTCEGSGLIKWERNTDTDISPDSDQLASVTQA